MVSSYESPRKGMEVSLQRPAASLPLNPGLQGEEFQAGYWGGEAHLPEVYPLHRQPSGALEVGSLGTSLGK